MTTVTFGRPIVTLYRAIYALMTITLLISGTVMRTSFGHTKEQALRANPPRRKFSCWLKTNTSRLSLSWGSY
jgi:hypothetical protein